MIVIGLTGGIGMGKSTAANAFRRAHIPVFDADQAVHALQAPGGKALPAIAAAFPGTVTDNTLDRAALRRAVIENPDALRQLEGILHPMVRAQQKAFLAKARRSRTPAAVLDIPLLLETGGKAKVDKVIVVSAPRATQIQRVTKRGKMNPTQIEAIIKKQMPDNEKQKQADLIVKTGLSHHHAQRTLRRFIRSLRAT